jgi:subtilisin family serine protease
MHIHLRSLASCAVVGFAVLVAPLAACTAPTQATQPHSYVVLYSGTANPTIARVGVHNAGGNLLAVYPEIGVAVARSGDAAFVQKLRQVSGVVAVAPTERHAIRLPDARGLQNSGGPEETAPATTPVPRQQDGDGASLAALQWDMKQIHAVEAHQVTQGSRKVLVGDIDTGLDYTHPNLAPNVDFENSVSCIGGTPNQSPAAWADDNGHGTHTAGTIAATSQENGLGMDGVAPNVRIAGIKAGDSNGFFFPEAVVCAFMWAGNHHMDVTNNSYYADPWLYNCLNDPDQLAIWTAEKRAIDFAMRKGVTVVVAAGNFVDDLAHPSIDPTSPDNGTPVTRDVSSNCFTVPSMVPGVITVSADGNKLLKSYYSNYGAGYIKLTAPGGDRRTQVTADAPNGRVLSTYPASLFNPTSPLQFQVCREGTCGTYAYLQGTSMAAPHVAGLAALIVSQLKSRNRGGDGDRVSPARVLEVLTGTADPLPCPANPYLPAFHAFSLPGTQPAHCEGSPSNNSFYGAGQINALRAVSEN